jgi:hypothetical protein
MDGAASEENKYECPDTLCHGTVLEFLLIAHTVKIPEILKRMNYPSPLATKRKTAGIALAPSSGRSNIAGRAAVPVADWLCGPIT